VLAVVEKKILEECLVGIEKLFPDEAKILEEYETEKEER